jgi:hypothetical protein
MEMKSVVPESLIKVDKENNDYGVTDVIRFGRRDDIGIGTNDCRRDNLFWKRQTLFSYSLIYSTISDQTRAYAQTYSETDR